MLTEQREVRSKWKDYFRDLLARSGCKKCVSRERQKEVWQMKLQKRRLGGNDGSYRVVKLVVFVGSRERCIEGWGSGVLKDWGKVY